MYCKSSNAEKLYKRFRGIALVKKNLEVSFFKQCPRFLKCWGYWDILVVVSSTDNGCKCIYIAYFSTEIPIVSMEHLLVGRMLFLKYYQIWLYCKLSIHCVTVPLFQTVQACLVLFPLWTPVLPQTSVFLCKSEIKSFEQNLIMHMACEKPARRALIFFLNVMSIRKYWEHPRIRTKCISRLTYLRQVPCLGQKCQVT